MAPNTSIGELVSKSLIFSRVAATEASKEGIGSIEKCDALGTNLGDQIESIKKVKWESLC